MITKNTTVCHMIIGGRNSFDTVWGCDNLAGNNNDPVECTPHEWDWVPIPHSPLMDSHEAQICRHCGTTTETRDVAAMPNFTWYGDGSAANFSIATPLSMFDGTGGIVGSNQGTVSGSHNAGNVSGGNLLTGGVVGVLFRAVQCQIPITPATFTVMLRVAWPGISKAAELCPTVSTRVTFPLLAGLVV